MGMWTLAKRGRLTVVAAAMAMLAGCGGSSLGQSDDGGDDTLKVGLVVAQSGVYSAVGRDMEQGFRLFLKEHDNQIGGHDVEVVTVDEGETPQSGVVAATRLVQQEQVDVVVGVVTGPTAMGSRDIFDSSKVPVLLGNTGSIGLGGDLASDWIWRAAYDNRDPGRALGTYLAKDSSSGDVFLMAADYAGGHETIQGFKDTFPADRVAGEVYTPFGTTSDFSPYISKILASGASQVFCFYAGGEAIEFTKQAASFGLSSKVKLYGTFLTDGAALLKAEGQAALGVRNAIRYNWDLDNEQNKAFVAAYQDEYDVLPSTPAATMYDVGVILDRAVQDIGGAVTRESINDALGGIGSVDGVRGELKFDDSRTIVGPTYLTEVQKTPQGLLPVTIEALPRP
ncbi:ABC transporter substrate-binding protein [Nonomuraea sp. NPDC049400]|uniref:ABC transporter substrate-binding protein n=1 Tax=Nonomuraea sp. NPDC049400 TaxID=3364352 RepID=UPI0037B1FC09